MRQLQGHQPFSAAVQATYDTLKALRDGVTPSELKGVASAATMLRTNGLGTSPEITSMVRW